MTESSSRYEVAQYLLRDLYEEIRRSGKTKRLEEADSFLLDDIEPAVKASFANILAHHHFHSGDYRNALRYCRKWLELDPDNLFRLSQSPLGT